MNIREMTISDIDSVKSIAAAAWKDTYSQIIPEEIQEKGLKQAYSNEEMDNRFKASLNFVAEDSKGIMGYAFFSGKLSENDVFLESLYVHPAHQGKGIGKQLMAAGISKFKEPTSVSLTVYKGNLNFAFYEKLGFKVIKENKGDFFGHPVGFIKMKKIL